MTKKRALLIVGLVLVLAAAGVVYTLWSDSLRLEVDIATGTIDPQWSLDGTNDDGEADGWDGEVVPSAVYTYDDPTSNDPSAPYAPGTVTRVYTAGFNLSDTGWAGWSCPAGTYPVAGSDGEGHAMQVSKAAVPSDSQYPTYPHYTYTPPEVGWVWQSAADGQGSTGLVLWVDCMSGGPSPRYDKDVADCFAELLPDAAENPNDLLHVTISNAYPSYWCTVKADLHNVGTVPVKLQSIAVTSDLGDVIETQFADFEGLLACGYQLDPGVTRDFYLSFHPVNPVEQGAEYSYDVSLGWVNYNEYDPALCQEPGGPIVTAGAPTWTKGGGVRIKGYNTGKEIFIGPMTDASALPRSEVEYNDFQTVATKTYQVTFSHDGSGSIATSITSPDASATWASDAYGCLPADWDAMEILVRDGSATSGAALQNVMLGAFSLGNFGTVDKAGSPGWQNWTVTGFDFSQSFTVTADLVVDGYNASESIKIEFNVGCLP